MTAELNVHATEHASGLQCINGFEELKVFPGASERKLSESLFYLCKCVLTHCLFSNS